MTTEKLIELIYDKLADNTENEMTWCLLGIKMLETDKTDDMELDYMKETNTIEIKGKRFELAIMELEDF